MQIITTLQKPELYFRFFLLTQGGRDENPVVDIGKAQKDAQVGARGNI